MEEKSELGDIILNKNTTPNNNKKIILAVATLGIILIIVVLLMNSFSSSKEENLPQAVLPPKPTIATQEAPKQEPLFEDVEVVEEPATDAEDARLEAVAQKLKAQTQEETVVEEVPEPVVTPKQSVKRVVKKQPTPKKITHVGHYYIQVGSFTKYKPNKEFLHKITSRGYDYKFHKVTRNGKTLNKVLIGPFKTEKEARKALKTIRKHIEKGAFLTKI